MLEITPTLAIPEGELTESFIRGSGPGGQNVNKVNTAVQLRFNALRSPSLPDAVRARLLHLAGRRLAADGTIVITAQRFRTQERNRDDARRRLRELIAAASVPPDPPRRPTRPSRGAMKRRLDTKTRRGAVKRLRESKPSFD